MLIRIIRKAFLTCLIVFLTILLNSFVGAQNDDGIISKEDSGKDAVDDQEYMNSYQTGREYFFLRSGKTKMVIQADKSGIAPAFTYMLFNAEDPVQTARKTNALNYIQGTNFSQTALKVFLGKVAFSALGHNSEAKWITRNGKAAVELLWWAGGVRVKENFSISEKMGNFERTISLTNADLAGDDTLRIGGLDGYKESGPVPVKKGETITFIREVPVPAFLTTEGQNTLQSPLSSVLTSDSIIFSLYRNASFSLPGMVSANGRMDAGVFEYGNQWVRDGSNVAMGLIYAGSFENAKGLLTYILSDLVSDEGSMAIAGGYDKPDREEFDQMGVLMNCLKLYSDWTGDISLLITYRKKILTLIERYLNPVFRDSTGMVHNKREFWERTFSDGYELAYQTYMIQGLRDASELSGILGVPEKAEYWRRQADIFLNSMLNHPTRSLVDNGALIKRRNVNGEIADFTVGRQDSYKYDAPLPTEYNHRLNPDATYAIPVLLGIIDPRSSLARKSLDKLESIWNARWDMGGYERYHSSSQIDQPGPWTFGTAFIARAQHDAGLLERSRRSLLWLHSIEGGNSGAWFEEIPLNRSQIPTCGIVPWTSAEVTSFVVRHWLGVKVSGEYLIIKPNFYPGTKSILADLRFRSGRLKIEMHQKGRSAVFTINGKVVTSNKYGAYKILIPGNK